MLACHRAAPTHPQLLGIPTWQLQRGGRVAGKGLNEFHDALWAALDTAAPDAVEHARDDAMAFAAALHDECVLAGLQSV